MCVNLSYIGHFGIISVYFSTPILPEISFMVRAILRLWSVLKKNKKKQWNLLQPEVSNDWTRSAACAQHPSAFRPGKMDYIAYLPFFLISGLD